MAKTSAGGRLFAIDTLGSPLADDKPEPWFRSRRAESVAACAVRLALQRGVLADADDLQRAFASRAVRPDDRLTLAKAEETCADGREHGDPVGGDVGLAGIDELNRSGRAVSLVKELNESLHGHGVGRNRGVQADVCPLELAEKEVGELRLGGLDLPDEGRNAVGVGLAENNGRGAKRR